MALVYLRNRYLSTDLGTFISPDPTEGDIRNPMSLNRYTYVEGNPVNYTDPSGEIVCADLPIGQRGGCIGKMRDLRNNFGFEFTEHEQLSPVSRQNWISTRVNQVYNAAYAVQRKLGDPNLTRRAIGDLELQLAERSPDAEVARATACNKLTLFLNYPGVSNAVHSADNLIHEFGHVLTLGDRGRSLNSEALGPASDMHNRPVELWGQIQNYRGFPESEGWVDTWWQRLPDDNRSAEVVADMFLYWVRGYGFDTTPTLPGDVRHRYAEGFNLDRGVIPASDGTPLRRFDEGTPINDGSVIRSAGFEQWARQATCSSPIVASIDPLLKEFVDGANSGWCG